MALRRRLQFLPALLLSAGVTFVAAFAAARLNSSQQDKKSVISLVVNGTSAPAVKEQKAAPAAELTEPQASWDGSARGLLTLVHPVNEVRSGWIIRQKLQACSDAELEAQRTEFAKGGGSSAARTLISRELGREMARRHGQSVLEGWKSGAIEEESNAWLKGVFASLTEASPSAAGAAARQLGDHQSVAWSAIFSALRPAPGGSALAETAALAAGGGDEAQSAFSAWRRDEAVCMDPEGVFRWGRENNDPDAEFAALRALARTDPQRAVALWSANYSEYGAMEIAPAWASVDARAALTWVESLPETDRWTMLPQVLRELAWEDPAGTAERILNSAATLPEGQSLNSNVYESLISAWVHTDPAAAKEWILKQDPETLRVAADEFLTSGFEISPADAQDLLRRLPEDVTLSALYVGDVAEAAALTNPANAVEWAMSLSESHRNAAIVGIFSTWAGEDPAAVARALSSMTDDALRTSGISAAVETLEKAGDFASWTAQLPGDLRRTAWTLHIENLVETDPRAAAEAVVCQEQLDGGTVSADSITAVARTWAAQDGPAALAWVAAHASGEEAAGAIAEGITVWAGWDAEGAEAWLETLPPGEVRDAATAAFESSISDSGPVDSAPLEDPFGEDAP
jgi:hypothetical protein